MTAPSISPPIVVSACNPHDTFLTWLARPPAWPPHSSIGGGGYRTTRATNRRSTPSSPNHRRCSLWAGAQQRTAVVSPDLAAIDRGYRLMQQGGCSHRPGTPRERSDADRSVGGTRHSSGPARLQSRSALHPLLHSGVAGPARTEPQRWLERSPTLCEPGFLDSIVEYRAE